jgi:hypothetical protein
LELRIPDLYMNNSAAEISPRRRKTYTKGEESRENLCKMSRSSGMKVLASDRPQQIAGIYHVDIVFNRSFLFALEQNILFFRFKSKFRLLLHRVLFLDPGSLLA